MRPFLKLTTAAAALLGTVAFTGAPANAEWGISVGVGPAIGFDVHSGGYCDRWGCPGQYWAYPIFYGPVFYDGMWFRGPVYTRVVDGEHFYWIHGGWHRDQWRGPRPQWARVYHYGPALGLDYYREHGFRVNDRDWHDWNDHDRYRAYHAGYTEDRFNSGYDRYRDDRNWYRDRNGYGNDQNRYHDRYEHTGYGNDDGRYHDQYQHNGYGNDEGRYHDQYEHTGYGNDQGRYHDQYQHNGYGNDQGRYHDQPQHTGYDNSADYRDRNRGSEGDHGYDRNAYHSDEQGPPTKTGFEQQRGLGHPRTPPITSHGNTNSHSHHSGDRNPDRQDQNGPTE